MELLVATWTLRIALIGSLAAAGVSVAAGMTVIEAVDRAALTAFALTLLGRLLVGWLETPEQRLRRLRAKRALARAARERAPAAGRQRSDGARPVAVPAPDPRRA